MPKIIQGDLNAKGFKFGIVASRFIDFITARLLDGAVDALTRHGASDADIEVVRVPGAYEIPLVAQQLARAKKYSAVICLGAVIRGATPHFEYVSAEVSKGIAAVSMGNATGSLGEFKLVVEVTADGATAVPAVNEYQAQQLAQLWVSGLLAGRVDQVLAVSDLPFCWNRRELNKGGSGTRDDIGLLKTAADLQAKLEAVVKQQGVRNLAVSDATVLCGEQAVNYGAARFKQLDVPGIAYVQVKTGQRRVQVAIQPGTQLKVVGFAEMIGFGENAGVE